MNEFLRQGSVNNIDIATYYGKTSWKVRLEREVKRLPRGRPPLGVTAMPLLQAIC